jgi:Cpl-7 lysozyme-like protein
VSNSWDYVSKDIGHVKPETLSKAREIWNAARAAGHEIWYIWGMGSSAEHKTGRALDLMVRNEAAGDWVYAYIWKNRARLRLQHVIWEQHITSTVTKPGQRRQMPDRGNSTKNHYDHNHVLFLVGAYVAPGHTPSKPPVPKPPTPKPTPKPVPGAATAKVVAEVIAGKWGAGDDRKNRLRKAGWNPSVIQALVNQAVKRDGRKGLNHIVAEVIAGEWGNGDERKQRLTAAGYNYSEVQTEVNKRV